MPNNSPTMLQLSQQANQTNKAKILTNFNTSDLGREAFLRFVILCFLEIF